MAAQFTATNGFLARDEPATMDRATNSLPVPDSPVSSTVQLVSDTWASKLSTASMAGSSPNSQGAVRSRHATASGTASGGGVLDMPTAPQRASSRLSTPTGLTKKSRAPRRMARTASGICALPLITMTGVRGHLVRTASRMAKPSAPGMRRSVTTASKISRSIWASPPGPSVVTTS